MEITAIAATVRTITGPLAQFFRCVALRDRCFISSTNSLWASATSAASCKMRKSNELIFMSDRLSVSMNCARDALRSRHDKCSNCIIKFEVKVLSTRPHTTGGACRWGGAERNRSGKNARRGCAVQPFMSSRINSRWLRSCSKEFFIV